MTIAVIACGSYVYQSEHITKAENWYHLPEEAGRSSGINGPEEGRVMAIVPSDLIYYIRQYSSRINMPWKEMLIARWDYYNDIYEAMEEAEVIETTSFVELTRSYGCNYVVLKKDRDRGTVDRLWFTLYAQTDNYLIYQDMELSK